MVNDYPSMEALKIILSKANITAVTGAAVFHAFASFIFLSNIISVMFTAYQVVNFVAVWNSTGYFQSKFFTLIAQ